MARQPLARLKIGAALFTPASNSASMPGLTSICAISVIMAAPCNAGGNLACSAERSTENAEQDRAGYEACKQCTTPARGLDRTEQRQAGERDDSDQRQVIARI